MKIQTEQSRIGIFVIAFPKHSETFIVTKVLGLLDMGFDVQIFAMKKSNDWDQFEVLQHRDDVKTRVHIAPPISSKFQVMTIGIVYLLTVMVKYPRAFWRFLLHCWKYRQINPLGFGQSIYARSHFIGHKLDLLHIEFDFQAGSIVDLRSYLKCKLLLSSRGAFRRTGVLNRNPTVLDHIFNHVDAYHFISMYLRNELLQLGFPESIPYKIIEPAIDIELFHPRNKPLAHSDTVHILSIGRLTWAKGYEFALDAIAMVYAEGISLKYIILGKGDYKEPVVFNIKQNHLTDIVELIGFVPREKVTEYLEQADIVIHAAIEEGFCNAILEAQAMEVPVVVSDAGGLPENVEDGVSGFVVPRRNPRAMAEKIVELINNQSLRETMGKAGRKRVVEKFDINIQVEEFVQFYNEILEM